MTGASGSGSHWDHAYTSRRDDGLSWYQALPEISLRLLHRFAAPTGSIIDVGGGSSPLIAALLDAGWRDVTVLDVSGAALALARERLGKRARKVTLLTRDLLSWKPARTYDAWHDRAVFHFLVDHADRESYLRVATQAVASGGVLVLGTFADDGPTACSGLPTARYDADALVRIFAGSFTLEHSEREAHHAPSGTLQPFTWVVLQRIQNFDGSKP